MKKKIIGGLLIVSCLILSIGLYLNVSATEDKLTKDRDIFSFSTQESATEGKLTKDSDMFSFSIQESTTLEDSVSRFNREDWYSFEDVQPGLMSVEVSWENSYDIDCYISTSASKFTSLARGATSDNPESCSYNIETAGTYYIGIILRSKAIVTTPYSVTVTWYADSGEPDTTDPTVSITSPNDYTTVGNSISITATAEDSESGMDYVDCTFGSISLGADSLSPYAWTFDTKSVDNGDYTIEVIAYDNAGNFASDTISVEVFNDDDDDGEKIAVFFWASDAGAQWVIDEYWAVLQAEGYTKIFNFEDTSNFDADFNTIEAYEDPEDTIFFYLFGHGNNNGEDSFTAFAPGTSVVYSSELRVLFDTLDAGRIGYLVESCHSGGFPVDFNASPYLAMSTSDEDHNSYAISSIPGEGIFSDAFFNHVFDGNNAVESFYYARQVVFDQARNPHVMQYPLIADYSDYVWFV